MKDKTKSPKITNISWGQIQIEDHDKPYKDVKLYPGGSREWNWNETGTHHSPGIQPQDVKELVNHGAREVVLARGFNRRLKVKQETIEYLRQKGIRVHVLETEKAVKRYNELVEQKPVGALIHSTC